IRRDGKVEELKKGGFFLGIFPEVRYEMDEVELIPGDLLLLYSDGLTEATNEKEEEYGEERLISLVKRERDLPLAKLRERIIDDLLTFTGEKPFSDDLTLLLIRLKDNA
ncbi:MAG: serine/threonine-protein phosphatase, partial [Acidobacteria bacterium]|nr:serine/threonine-protein phosphatase [Acidobacteriota bacterium]